MAKPTKQLQQLLKNSIPKEILSIHSETFPFLNSPFLRKITYKSYNITQQNSLYCIKPKVFLL